MVSANEVTSGSEVQYPLFSQTKHSKATSRDAGAILPLAVLSQSTLDANAQILLGSIVNTPIRNSRFHWLASSVDWARLLCRRYLTNASAISAFEQ